MKPSPVWILAAVALAFAPGGPSAHAQAPDATIGVLGKAGFDQNLGRQVPMDALLRDEGGKAVRLGELMGRRPAVLAMVYYNCPMLCTQVLNSVARSLKVLSLEAGKDFDVIAVSIDPTDTPELATLKKANYLKRYGHPGAEAGWHFLTGEEAEVRRVADAIGFRYVYDPKTRQYAHAAGITVLTPGGIIARYFYGLDYPAKALQFALMEASARKIGSPVDRMLLLCYDYDPRTGKYNFAIMGAIRVLGTATALAMGTFLFVMFRRDRRKGWTTEGPGAGPLDAGGLA
jgi:protein SCO1